MGEVQKKSKNKNAALKVQTVAAVDTASAFWMHFTAAGLQTTTATATVKAARALVVPHGDTASDNKYSLQVDSVCDCLCTSSTQA